MNTTMKKGILDNKDPLKVVKHYKDNAADAVSVAQDAGEIL